MSTTPTRRYAPPYYVIFSDDGAPLLSQMPDPHATALDVVIDEPTPEQLAEATWPEESRSTDDGRTDDGR